MTVLTMSVIVVVCFAFYIFLKTLGPPPLSIPQSSLYYAVDGTVIGESNSGEKRYWIELEEISPHFIDAVLAIEDRHFYDHYGFDLKRIGGAVIANIKSLDKVQGASTITQQYARNLFLTLDKTWKRKLSEAIYSLRLEINYDKNEILEGYMNTISFGHGAYGIEAASQYYFGKSATELTLSESALLAGIPKGPSIYSPINSYDRAKKRQELILHEMKQLGFISEQTAENAKNEPLDIIGKHPHHLAEVAPYFYESVKKELLTTVGLNERMLALGGLKVYTTLDPHQQEIAERVMDSTFSKSSDIQVGFAAMNPKNGHVTAMIGGRDIKKSFFNRATQAIRQPGSTIKPILYYAALEHGFTPATMLRSEATTFTFGDGNSEYAPNNFNQRYADDEVTMAQALAVSDNIYAVKTHLFLGQDVLVDTMRRFGFTTKIEQVPSLALGTSGVKVIDLLNAYSMIANGGNKIEPTLILKVEDFNGRVIYEDESIDMQVLDRDQAFVMSQMMTGMFDTKLNSYATVTGASIASKMSRPYAGKSGSTKSDSWMAGFTPGLAAVVWTGYDDGKEITLTEDKLYAKNMWIRFMEEAIAADPQELHTFKQPVGTVAVPIDPHTGKVATSLCPVFRIVYFKKGTETEEVCTDHIFFGDEVGHH